jgi:CIC family chloride channel protein
MSFGASDKNKEIERRHMEEQEAKLPMRSLGFMLLMALAVGVVAGIGAWVFRMLIGLVHNTLFLGQFAFEYDANVFTPPGPWGWGVIFVPVAGGLVVAWLVKNFAPEAKGHGVPEVMDAIYYNQGLIRPRVALIKSLASAISIGSGASVGREGPIVQIGSAFGSTLGALFPMRSIDRVTLIAAGAGAGIAATFNAPLGGVVFAIELLMVTINARNLLLVATATVVATRISHSLLGTYPSFYIPSLEIANFYPIAPLSLMAFVVLGAMMGLLSVAFIRGLYWMEDVFDAIPGNYYSRHALGMLCMGVLMYLLLRQTGHYYVEGVGYAMIMEVLKGVLSDPWFLLLLVALKLLATCLSLGSGASGGVFSPALFMGAAGGAAFGHCCQLLVPGLDIPITTFAIAGMAAAVGGSTGAVLTSIIMLTEMTEDSSAILPLIITCSVAYAVRKAIMSESIYTMKLVARGHAMPEGLHASKHTSRCLEELMESDFAIDSGDTGNSDGARIIVHSRQGKIVGVTCAPGEMQTTSQFPVPNSAVDFLSLPGKVNLLEAVGAVWEAEADLILVSRDPDAQQVEDIVGVVSRKVLARALKAETDLG